jgi:hypothetical protein
VDYLFDRFIELMKTAGAGTALPAAAPREASHA